MSTINFTTTQQLRIPQDAFSSGGVAVLLLQGARYGGRWAIEACYGPRGEKTIGSLYTEATEDPDVAAETAKAWIEQQCVPLGLKVIGFFNLSNDRYAPHERPFYTMSQVNVAGKDWSQP